MKALLAVIVLVTVVPTVAGVYIAWRAGSIAVDTARTFSAGSAATPAALTTAALEGVTAGYHAIQVAPPAGGYGAVDPVAALPWALAIAQAWADDARLERIDVERLRPDGTVNVQDDAEASLTYRFRSPVAVKQLQEQARLRTSAQAIVEFWVRVAKGTPQVFASEERGSRSNDTPSPPHPDAIATARLLQQPPVKKLHADLPYLDGYMIHLAGEGWVWYFRAMSGTAGLPRVRARDGRAYPY